MKSFDCPVCRQETDEPHLYRWRHCGNVYIMCKKCVDVRLKARTASTAHKLSTDMMTKEPYDIERGESYD